MYWICFGDSAMGMLMFARSALAPEMDRSRIISLIDDLSIGDISDLQDREARSFGICPWQNDPEFADSAGEYVTSYYRKALPAFEAVDEAIIWYGDNPAEQCGMLRAAHDLYARGVPFSLVHVDRLDGAQLPPPERSAASAIGIVTENQRLNFILRHTPQFLLRQILPSIVQKCSRKRRAQLVVYRGVGELMPGEAAIFYSRQRRVPECEAKLLYSRWEQLVRENAPLRVLQNGKPVSAPVGYYDEAILANTPEEETRAAVVVGRTLGNFAVNDSFIFERIRALALAGRLEIVKNGGNYRETTVRRKIRVDG